MHDQWFSIWTKQGSTSNNIRLVGPPSVWIDLGGSAYHIKPTVHPLWPHLCPHFPWITTWFSNFSTSPSYLCTSLTLSFSHCTAPIQHDKRGNISSHHHNQYLLWNTTKGQLRHKLQGHVCMHTYSEKRKNYHVNKFYNYKKFKKYFS